MLLLWHHARGAAVGHLRQVFVCLAVENKAQEIVQPSLSLGLVLEDGLALQLGELGVGHADRHVGDPAGETSRKIKKKRVERNQTLA